MSTNEFDSEIIGEGDSIIIESTLPPTTSHDLLEAEGATVLVFSHDAGLARVIRTVAAERYPIRIIDKWSDLLSQVGSGSGRIVLLDVDALSGGVEEALGEINRCTDWLVTVIAAKQHQAQDFMRFWSERRIHRLLIKPAAVGITRLLLESAFARFIELRELHENTDSMEIPQELVAQENAKQRRRWLWPAVTGGTLVAIAAVVYLLLPQRSPESNAVSSQIAAIERTAVEETDELQVSAIEPADQGLTETIDSEAPIATDLPIEPYVDPFEAALTLAEEAELRGDFVEPAEANALDHYLSIVTVAPENTVAQERLTNLLEDQFAIAQEQILARDYEGAETTLDHIARGNPSSSRLQFLRDQIGQLREAAAAAAEAEQLAVEGIDSANAESAVTESSEPTELQSMLTLLGLRLEEGLLIEPVGDSALDYLQRAADLEADDADVAPYVEQFAAQAVDAIPAALAAGNTNAASLMLSTAQDFGAANAELDALNVDVEAALAEIAREENIALHAQSLQRIDEGVLIAREDSATALLSLLRERSADESLIADIEDRLSPALSIAARTAISAGNWDDADSLLNAFATVGLEFPGIAELEEDLEFARRQEEFLAETITIGELTLLEAEPPAYPRVALANDITGWVDLQFTVNEEGTTTDIVVVASEPDGQFDNAATAAAERYIFEPYQLEDRIYQRRVRLRMRFELD